MSASLSFTASTLINTVNTPVYVPPRRRSCIVLFMALHCTKKNVCLHLHWMVTNFRRVTPLPAHFDGARAEAYIQYNRWTSSISRIDLAAWSWDVVNVKRRHAISTDKSAGHIGLRFLHLHVGSIWMPCGSAHSVITLRTNSQRPWLLPYMAEIDCTQFPSFLVHSNWENGASERQPRGEWGGRTKIFLSFLFPLPHSPRGCLPCSLQSRTRSRISFVPVSQLQREKKGTACSLW